MQNDAISTAIFAALPI